MKTTMKRGIALISWCLFASGRALRLEAEHGRGRTLPDAIKERIDHASGALVRQNLEDALYDYLAEGVDDPVKNDQLDRQGRGTMHVEPIPKAQEPADRGVAVLIHTYDGTNARKFWPLVLEGTARNLVADAPPGFKLYFAHDGVDDISCLTKNLSVPVTELKYGKKEKTLPPKDNPPIPFVHDMDYGWADSVIKSLEQVSERWLIFIQEDTAFPAHVDSSFLERIVDFAVMRDARFLQLTRTPTFTYFPKNSKCYGDGWLQEDLENATFYNLRCRKWVVNHNLALIDTKWWLQRAKNSRDRLDGGHFANEVYESWGHDMLTDEEREDLRNNIYSTFYNSPFSSNRHCDGRKQRNLNEWGCVEGSVPEEPTKIGMDMAVPIAHHGQTSDDHWSRNYTALGINTLQRLGLPVDGPSGFEHGPQWCAV